MLEIKAVPMDFPAEANIIVGQVTWPEAVALGIDDLEHGPVFTDTESMPDKKPDVCPAGGGRSSWARQEVNGAQVKNRCLVSRNP